MRHGKRRGGGSGRTPERVVEAQRSQRARTDHALEEALRVALELSDRWLLDGRDPSSYAMDGAA